MTKYKTYADDLDKWAALQPEKACLITKQIYTYRDIQEKTQAYAQKLRALGPRQTILIVKKEAADQAIAFLGAQRAGWVPILGHPDAPAEVSMQLAQKRHIAWLDDGCFRPSCPAAPTPAADICLGVLSSGSTGLPKLMLRTYASWTDFFPAQNEMFQVQQNTLALGEGSLSFTGNANLWLSLLYAGATFALLSGLHPRSWLRALAHYRVTLLYLVPVKLKLLLAACQEIYPTVRTVLAGSQLLEKNTVQQLRTAFPQSRIILYYGASEVDYVTWLCDDELLTHPGSVGRPCPGVKVSIRQGQIYIDTPYHVAGLTQPCTLGDCGYFDKDDYLIFQGRQGQVINKGGLTISCSHVEQALQALDGVQDAAVVPLVDSKRGQELGACLVLKPGVTLKKIRQELRKLLPPGEIPGKWRAVPALPLGSTGKVDSHKIQALFTAK